MTHQGYANRSTWLAHLWLSNTEPVYNEVKEAVERNDENTIEQLQALLERTDCKNEVGFSTDEIEWIEVLEGLAE